MNKLLKRKLVFASNNKHKIEEVAAILGDNIELVSMAEIGCHDDIPETADTLEGNASLKSRYIAGRYHVDVFADDTGMEVEALDNRPGVYSARYAGESKDPQDNMNKVLRELETKSNRKARFRIVISLILDGEEYLFEGIINGVITKEKRGEAGFGYDPIFMPDGYDKTFAEMGNDLKNEVSHRALAVKKLNDFLRKNND